MKLNYLDKIRKYWDNSSKVYADTHPEFLNESMHPSWGLLHIPEDELLLLKDIFAPGKVMVDLGCGLGHDSIAYARRGAMVYGIDISTEQLSRAFKHKRVSYINASAEHLPLQDESVDIVYSDHGPFDHSPADRLLPEVYRVLRDDGVLIICTYSPILLCCYNQSTNKIDEKLHSSYPFARDVKYNGEITFCRYSYSEWIHLFLEFGFTVDRLEEPILIDNIHKSYFDELVDDNWASKWPCDLIWLARKK